MSVAGIGSYYTNNVSGIGGTNSSSTYNTGVLSARNNTENFSVRHGSTYYLNSLAAPENEKATPKTDVEFAKGEVAYLLNGSQDAPNGPWYQNLTGPNCDPHPVLDPTHPAVYKVNGKYVNATYRSIANPTVTMDGGISLVELVSKLPKTVEVTSTIGTSTANVTWNTDSIKYDPKNFNAQTVTVSGTANVTGLLNGGEKPVTATVKVNAVTVNGLTVTTAPNLTYSQGGKLNLGNVKVTAKFSNGAVEILEHDTEGVTFVLGDQNIADGAALDKAQHNSQTLTLSYGGKTVELGQLVVQSSNNQISALTVSDQEAQYENGGYAVTLPPYSALPNADGIAVTLGRRQCHRDREKTAQRRGQRGPVADHRPGRERGHRRLPADRHRLPGLCPAQPEGGGRVHRGLEQPDQELDPHPCPGPAGHDNRRRGVSAAVDLLADQSTAR